MWPLFLFARIQNKTPTIYFAMIYKHFQLTLKFYCQFFAQLVSEDKRFENFLMFYPCYIPCVIGLRFCNLQRRSTFLPIYTISLNNSIRKCTTTMAQDSCLIGNPFQCKLRLFLLCRAIICRTSVNIFIISIWRMKLTEVHYAWKFSSCSR